MATMSEQNIHIQLTAAERGIRLDKALALHLPDFSRSQLQHMLKHDAARLGDKPLPASYKCKGHETITLNIPPQAPSTLTAEAITLDIIYEDEDIIILNKQAGLTVHPGAGQKNGTLVNALLHHYQELSQVAGSDRPGIVHRLDKQTSGLMVVAKHDQAHRILSEQLKERSIKRTYQAICWGAPIPSAGIIDAPLGRHRTDRTKRAVSRAKDAREARTHYRVIERFGNNVAALVECQLETGRTHQIRVHMQHIGHPLIGDAIYGGRRNLPKSLLEVPEIAGIVKNFPRQALHAAELTLHHPHSKQWMEWNCNFQQGYAEDINKLFTHLKLLKSD